MLGLDGEGCWGGRVDRDVPAVGEGRARCAHTAAHDNSSLEEQFSFDSPGSDGSADGGALCVVGSLRSSLPLGPEIPNHIWVPPSLVCLPL